ncbi:MAG TPA: serine/threonine-protein kinase, partial [Bryobacteraceae bacterium]|nr:serine/threonine-protein kinase [Bryobacteraceae bacterium]
MDSARWERIQEIFHRASDIPPAEQPEFLRTACAGDQALMAELLAMLEEDARGAPALDEELPHAVRNLLEKPRAAAAEGEFGPYRIIRHLGEGGMGVVYLATREDIGSLVAIKLLRDGLLSPERRRRFASEQKTLARLDHPLIAQIHDADTLDDGTPWFAMEYVEGQPITDDCRARACSIDERLRLFRSVCEAVQYAHRQTIVHRDLKPSNILVKLDGTVKLLDFGIAKQLPGTEGQVEQTRTELRPMTLPYASPEQIRGDPLGTQTDVYSLGVILYELLAGQLPFDFSNRSRTEAEQTILGRDPDPPSTAARRMSASKTAWADLDTLSLTAMHKDLQRRYRSVEALIRDIDHYLKGEPLEARPDSLPYRLGKFVRRNRRALSASGAAAAIFVALVVFFVVRLAKARNAALAEATRTQRIERLMLNMFDGGDKAAGPADSLRAVTLLDRGAQSARTLNAEPAVQAELYQTLANMYQKLGKFDQADALLRASLERRKSIAGPDSRDVAGSLVALGLLRLEQGQLAEAERFAREGLAMDRRRLAPNDAAVAKDQSALGRVLEERGAYDEAIKVLDDAVRIQSARREATTDLSDSISWLATAHLYLGHRAQADSLFERALAMDRELYGAVHPRVAGDLYNLGVVQHDLGRDADAERSYRQALDINQSWYGKEHPDSALMMAAVGQSLIYQGHYDEAAPLLQQALAIQEGIFGKVHPQVAIALNQLGVLELRRGHFAEAERDFTRMADINRQVYDDRHPLVGVALLNRGQVYLEEKSYARAEQSFREALARFIEKLPAGHSNTMIAQLKLGHTLVLERQYKNAESHLLAGYDVLVKQPDPSAPRLKDARTDLATVYDALHEPAQ